MRTENCFYEYCHDCDRSDSSRFSLFQSPPSSSVSCCSADSDDVFSNDCSDEAISFANFTCCGNSCLNKITRDEREPYGTTGK